MWPLLSENPSSTELTFWLCAFGGTLFFLLRVMMAIVGGFGADDFDGHADGHADGHDSHDAHDTEAAFKLFSLNSISSFVMMFGWSGLTAIHEYQLGGFISVLIAVIVGFVTMGITAYMFLMAYKLTSSGADFKIEEIVGQRAKVYQRIPATGSGKIQISVNGMLREIEAESHSRVEIASFAPVVVKEIVSPNLVSVEVIIE